jgi:hypothetical protein
MIIKFTSLFTTTSDRQIKVSFDFVIRRNFVLQKRHYEVAAVTTIIVGDGDVMKGICGM